MDQRERNMDSLNRIFALFVGEVFKESKAKQETGDQTELVRLIKEDILTTMENHLGRRYRCDGSKDCAPGWRCTEDGYCVPAGHGFTWSFLDVR
jgi:hypothetical protein